MKLTHYFRIGITEDMLVLIYCELVFSFPLFLALQVDRDRWRRISWTYKSHFHCLCWHCKLDFISAWSDGKRYFITKIKVTKEDAGWW